MRVIDILLRNGENCMHLLEVFVYCLHQHIYFSFVEWLVTVIRNFNNYGRMSLGNAYYFVLLR